MKFLNSLPWWASLESGLNWSFEERSVSGVILSAGCFIALVPFFILVFLFEALGLDKHNSSFISLLISVPLSVYVTKVLYVIFFPEYFKRAEAKAAERRTKSGEK